MLKTLHDTLDNLDRLCLSTGYELLLEADVVGWLFHLLLTQPTIDPKEIHLDTRVCNADPGKRFDVAAGALRPRLQGRPCVEPRLVVEVKIFPRIGFTDQQHRVHYEHVLHDDLPKLGSLGPSVECRASLLVDGRGYLDGTYQGRNRRDTVLGTRDEIAPGVHLFLLRHKTDRNWRLEDEPG
jgi:hypothetical protein